VRGYYSSVFPFSIPGTLYEITIMYLSRKPGYTMRCFVALFVNGLFSTGKLSPLWRAHLILLKTTTTNPDPLPFRFW